MKKSLTAFTPVAVVLFAFLAVGSVRAHAQDVGVTAPSVPSGVVATAGPLPGQASVSWTASTESSGTIAGYYVYRNGVGVASTTGVSFSDTGLVSGVYGYSVAAYDTTGNVSQQSVAFAVAVTGDTAAPSVPTNVTIAGVTTTNSYYAATILTISWPASTDNVTVTGYRVYRNGTMITSSTVIYTGTSITDSVLPGSYSYAVSAYDAAGNVSARSTPATVAVIADNAAPATPTNLAIRQTGTGNVALLWTASADNVGVAGYQVFRNGIWIASSTTTSYQDSGLSVGASYAYVVAAYDAAGNISPQSAPVTETIQSVTGPGAPIIAGGTLIGTSSVQLSWSPSADVLPISGYALYRNDILVTTVSSTSYLDTGLAPGMYLYNVIATDVSGTSSPMSATSTIVVLTPSATAAATSPAVTTSTPTGSSAPATASVGITFTQSLSYGMRNAQVTALQALLVAKGYLSPVFATGFFGNITLKALEKFQCDHAVACSGGAGWGVVGPKTRAVLNSLKQGTGSTSASVSATAQSAQLQALQAELASLEKQISAGTK